MHDPLNMKMKFTFPRFNKTAGQAFSIILLALLVYTSQAQLTVTGGLTQAQIQSLLFGPDVTITNFTVKCPNGSFGSFNGTNSNIGLGNGVILATGKITEAPGPNNSCGAGGGACTGSDTPTGGGSDACLDAYKNGPSTCAVGGPCVAGCSFQSFVNGVCTCMGCSALNSSSDACGLEFDVTPTCDTIKINYVFASEEYPEFVNGQYSDAFAFFISGPGITGTVCSNSKNIALVPGTNTPINIDNINATTNSQYYINNGSGTTPTVNNTVQYDGFTRVLTAKTKVTPCATYHIKMVIADYGDWKYNSAVFLQKGGINCGTPPGITVTKVDPIECCNNNGSFTITLDQAQTIPYTISYNLSGTATSGTDYSTLPGKVTIPAGQTTVKIPVNVLCDNLTEGPETIILKIGQTVCAGILTGSSTITINEGIVANAGPDIAICASGTTLNATGGGTYLWSPAAGLSCTTCANPVANPSATTKYVVSVTTNGCTATDTVLVTVSCGPTVTVAGGSVCSGGCQNMTATTAGGSSPYTYSWSPGGATTATINACPAATTTYTVRTTDNSGASSTSTATVTINPSTTLTANKTDISCAGGTNGTATGSAAGGTGPYSYLWSNGQTNAVISNLTSGTYTITSTDSKGCTQIATTTIIQPAALSLVPASGSAGCGNSNGSAAVTGSGGTGALTYVWSNAATGQTITGAAAGSYTVTATDSKGCTRSVVVTISNSPSPTITGLTATTLQCNGANSATAMVAASGGTGTLTYSWSNGSAGVTTITGLAANTYVVSVTDANGCIAVSTVSVTGPSAITINTTPVSSTCGQPNGQASVIAAGGTGALTYNWSNSAAGQTISGLIAATYTVTVNDANGCTTTALAVVGNTTGGTATASVQSNVVCNGANNGVAIVNVSGGTPGFTYSWNNGSAGPTAANLAPGSYSVTITDATGCTSSSAVTITEPPGITANISSSPATCGISNGSVTVNAAGGGGTLMYSWSSPGATGSSTSGLAAGSYTVTITDAQNCTKTAVAIISNIGTGIVTATVQSNVSCNGGNNGSAIASITGGNPSYTYTWSNGSVTQTAGGLAGGIFTVTVTDASNCQIISTVTITEPAAITASTTPVAAACGLSNGSASVMATGGTGTLSFVWSNGQTGPTASALAPGTYTVTITDSGSCSKTSFVSVSSNPSPTITGLTGKAVLCNGGNDGSAAVVASGGTGALTYSWSTAAAGTVITGLAAGIYGISVTDASGCTAVSTVTITEPAPINQPTFTTTNASCGVSNGSATASVLGGTGSLLYNWNNGTNGATASNLPAGSYTVTVIDVNGCTKTGVANVSNNGGPAITSVSPSNLLCRGGNSGSATVLINSGTTPYTYNWSTGTTVVTTSTQSIVSNLQSGIYTVTVIDANNCQVISTVTITEPLAISIMLTTSDAACGQNNGSATATGSGGTGTLNYLWSNGAVGPTAANLAVASYTVTITDANNCAQTGVANVVNTGAPTGVTSVASPIACNGGTGTVAVTISGGTGPYTYSWNNGVGSVSGSLQYDNSNVASGTYTVTVTDSKNCVIVSTVSITEPPVLTITTGSAPSQCGKHNGFVYTTVSGGSGTYTYNWSNGGVSNAIGNLDPASYAVTVTDNKGCTAVSSAVVKDTTYIITNDTPAKQTIIERGSIAFTVTGAVTYSWSPAVGLSCTNCPNPVATPTVSAIYTVMATDAGGCTVIVMIDITVKPPCIGEETDLFIANVFSPNNDGINDVLFIQGNGLTNIYWGIYDRWGNLLFETLDQSHGWDGTRRGNPMESGVYVYYLRATCTKTNTAVKLKGNITLVK